MSSKQSSFTSDPLRTVKKLFLSCFVVFAFMAYVVVERLTRPDSPLFPAGTPTSMVAAPATLVPFPAAPGVPPPTDLPAPTQVPAANGASSAYKNGTFQGQTVDAYYGLVQVQVDIQGGTIRDVTFLQYPNDRRTSQQINSIAMPYLQQEAVQAQSAHVDIISGATLTSEGFQMSLQSALQAARQN